MANEGRALLLALISGIGLSGFYLAVAALFPRTVERSRLAADRSPGRSFLVGFVNVFFLGALGLGFTSLAESSGIGFFQLIALLLFSVLAIISGYGLTGLSQLTGGRLIPQAHPTWQNVLGGWVLLLASLTPFIGWFALFPYLALVATGSTVLGWVRSRRRRSSDQSETVDRTEQASG